MDFAEALERIPDPSFTVHESRDGGGINVFVCVLHYQQLGDPMIEDCPVVDMVGTRYMTTGQIAHGVENFHYLDELPDEIRNRDWRPCPVDWEEFPTIYHAHTILRILDGVPEEEAREVPGNLTAYENLVQEFGGWKEG